MHTMNERILFSACLSVGEGLCFWRDEQLIGQFTDDSLQTAELLERQSHLLE